MTTTNMSICFLCNDIGQWTNLVTEGTFSMLTKILNEDLSVYQSHLCDSCHSIMYDYELYELKLQKLHKRINSIYSATAYVRQHTQHSAALNATDTEELVIDDKKTLNDVIMVYGNVVDGDLIEEELSDGGQLIENVSEIIEEDPAESESQEMLLDGQNVPVYTVVSNLDPEGVPDSPYEVNGNIFICKLCDIADNYTEHDRNSMELHLKNQHGEEILICKLCVWCCKEKDELEGHIDEHHRDLDAYIKCDQCDLRFGKLQAKSLRAHKRIHSSQGSTSSDSKNHACNMCDKKFASAKLLGEHQNTHSGLRPYKCSECSKDFASKYTLATHLKTHSERPRPYKCNLCSKAFLTSHNLATHKKLHSDDKSYECDVCQKKFATEHNLTVHQIIHNDFKPFICRWPDCGKSFARRNEIKDHERIHTGEKPFECELCNAKFSQRSNLLSHKKATHLNEKRHVFEQCYKAFKRRRLLDYHIKACHTGERPFKCETCGATFVYPEHFKKHQRNSCGRRDGVTRQVFTCSMCKLLFITSQSLAYHMREEHLEGISEKGSKNKQKPVASEFLENESYTMVAGKIADDDEFEDDEATVEMINEEDLIEQDV